ncbi:hypothetical protein ACFPYI_00405 [Halomarina salina]|uniref:DUF4239 domain-containing protein n=1 Tax=Halomarina salina TaxID=1872699 RepID=A0ABD5RH66_9EURY|nr:hypothetical protein [Halomarina salina]
MFEDANPAASLQRRLYRWLLVGGSRRLLSGTFVLGSMVLLAAAIHTGVVTVGYSSSIRSWLSSGVTSGLLTLVTVSLSINQLVLSRVFAPVDELDDRFDGMLSLKRRLETHADAAVAPNDPSALLSMVGRTLGDRAEALPEDGDVGDLRERVRSYGDDSASIEEGASTTAVLESVLGDDYASNYTRTRELRRTDDHPPDTEERLEGVQELLRVVALVRQYLKTIAIQQQLARLSRLVAYTGFLALLTTALLTFVYESSSGAVVPEPWLPWLVTLGFGVLLSPLALLVSYVVRAATIARYTVAVGPLVPPEETVGSGSTSH